MKDNILLGDVVQQALLFLKKNQVDVEEADVRYLIMTVKNWSLGEYMTALRAPISCDEWQWLDQAIKLLKEGYPVQYITGKEWFYDRPFNVTSATLIPRPETELLVEQLLQRETAQSLKVADIGTGTGAIAITLKKECPEWEVYASDISKEALEVAKENANQLQADVHFLYGDTLMPYHELLDVIISNPPYIAFDDPLVAKDVRQFEPHIALFAEEDGYAIYRRLCEQIPNHLAENGRIYLEIGYNQGEKVKQLVQEVLPYHRVEVKKDYSGHDRMVIAWKEMA